MLFYNFLCNSDPAKIKRKIIINNIVCVGLRMIVLTSFIKALKIAWLRGILQQSQPSEWSHLSFINFHTLFSLGGTYAVKQSYDLHSRSWKNKMPLWAEFCNTLPVENIGQVLESPLWYNENIRRGKVFSKDWHDCDREVARLRKPSQQLG